ncbi:MAG: hypothetical protein AB7O65_03010 [Candidatus Korobacteraceae bacterium]
MIYLKSTVSGLLAVLIIVIASPFVMLPLGILLHRKENGEGAIGWDPLSWLLSSFVPWLILLMVFAAGFFWEFRRLPH